MARDAYIYAALRTPVGTHGGALASVRADDLAATVVKAVVEKARVDPDAIDDVIFGCANQSGEDNRNVARMAVLLAGLPVTVPGQTVNRLCGSGLQACASAAQAIRAEEGSLFVAGGVESMTRAPYVMLKSAQAYARAVPEMADTTVGWRFVNPRMRSEWTIALGETAEVVAEQAGVTREEQDAFALASQQKAAAAIARGVFEGEIVPVNVAGKRGEVTVVDRDEHPRPETTREMLAKLRPAFRKDGTVTAGSSSGINDGAAALVIGDAGVAERFGVAPLAKVLGSAVAGLDPSVMGLGPVPATRKLLARLGMTVADFDLFEVNEAFAAQGVPCVRELGLPEERVNIYGGAIALGHPLGATGAKLLATLTHALHREDARRGIVTMCIGVGQGIALAIERVD